MRDLDTLSWYALGIPLYVIYVAAEIAVARRRGQRAFSLAETVSNLTAGLGTMIIGLFVGPFVMRGWNLVHDRVAPFPWPDHAWWKLPAALLVSDFCYYVYHRAGHRFAAFWAIHGVHHQHEHLNSSVGFRLEWLADPYAALFFVLMPLLGIDAATGFLAIALLSAYTLTAHTPMLSRPTWGLFITPAIHGSHHSRDARFSEKNYGAMLGIWDRLFGTWLEPAPGDRMRADVPSISRSHNGVTAQFGLVAELARALRRREVQLWSRPKVEPAPGPLRDDAEIPPQVRVYVLVHFLFLIPVAAWLLWMRQLRPFPVQVAFSAVIVGGLYSLGALLDGAADALAKERLRLAGTLLVGSFFASYSPAMAIALFTIALGGLLATPRLLARAPA